MAGQRLTIHQLSEKIVHDDNLEEKLQNLGLYEQLNLKAPIESPIFTGTPMAPTASEKSNSAQIATTEYVDRALNSFFPIGMIYMSVENVNPATFIGGTWTVWGKGRVPVGVDTIQAEFDTVEKTGGAKTHTLSKTEMPSHYHTVTDKLTNLQMEQFGRRGVGPVVTSDKLDAKKAIFLV
jgi:hypothetical protein